MRTVIFGAVIGLVVLVVSLSFAPKILNVVNPIGNESVQDLDNLSDGGENGNGGGNGEENSFVWEELKVYSGVGNNIVYELKFSSDVDSGSVSVSDFDVGNSESVSGQVVEVVWSGAPAPAEGATMDITIEGEVVAADGSGTVSSETCSDEYNDGSTTEC